MTRRAPLLLGGGALVVVLALLTALPAQRPTDIGATQLAAATTLPRCADVQLVGVDGNAERPAAGRSFGPTLQALTAAYVTRMRSDRTVVVRHVGGRFPAVTVLTKAARRHHVARSAIPASAVRRWMAPVSRTASQALASIQTLLRSCPSQQLVLAGYAQGASVAHRVLVGLARAGLLPRVTGVALVSDPDRRAGTLARRDGDPAAPRSRRGLAQLRLLAKAPDVPAASGTYQPWEICTRNDLVCDPGSASVKGSAGVATSYVAKRHVDPLIGRARSARVTSTGSWPVPVGRLRVVPVSAGQPVAVQLAAATSPAAHGVLWQAAEQLPGDFALTPSGLLTGTAPQSGVLTIPVTVKGASPVTPAAVGTVSITVAGATTGMSGGGQTSCETRADGTAWCWGRGDFGQLGNGTSAASSTEQQVSGTGWTQISTGGSTTCGVKTDHSLWCWGLNNYDQTGRAASGPLTTPRQVGTSRTWQQVAVGWAHACALQVGGQLYCWGQNARGQLGIGSAGGPRPAPTRVGSGVAWRSVVAGGWHTCATQANGTAWCWGDNAFGGLGIGTTSNRTAPALVSGSVPWRTLSASWNGTCGVAQSGALYCWGRNNHGEIGDGTTLDRAVPTAAAGGHQWLSVATGDGSTCALDTAGAPWCWGDNHYRQSSATSVARVASPTAPRGVSGQTQLTAGWSSYCASGTSISCWGSSEAGQLGPAVPVPAAAAPSSRPVISTAQARVLDRMTPAQVARHDLAGRPAVTRQVRARTAARTTRFRVMTYNVLGSNHTKPGADAQTYAPARLRAEWSSNLMNAYAPSLLGTQEAQPDQISDLGMALGGTYSIYPGAAQGYSATPQSLMFRPTAWRQLWRTSISVPFVGGWRPQPVVRLQSTSTGAQLYFINIHMFPGASHHAARARAMSVLVAEINRLKADRLPIVLTGDFNEKKWVYCQVTGRTPLRAASGGRRTASKCVPPKNMRVDWMFASRGTWSAYHLLRNAAVQRTTDHTIEYATFTMG